MNDALSLSPRGAALVKSFEGCLQPAGGGRFKAYICPAGKLTIGWGHTNDHGRRFDANSTWTQADCDAEFLSDMRGFERAVRRLVAVELTQGQFDALVSFAYNCGEGALAGSTLLKRLNAGDADGAAREFGKWTHGGGRVLPGLVRRRAAEAVLFQDARQEPKPKPRLASQPIEPEADEPAEPMPQAVDKPMPDKPLTESRTLWSVLGQIGAALGSVGAFLTDYRVVAVLCVTAIIGGALFIGRERIVKWIEDSH